MTERYFVFTSENLVRDSDTGEILDPQPRHIIQARVYGLTYNAVFNTWMNDQGEREWKVNHLI